MKIIDYNKNLDKKNLSESAYQVCGRAEFPVNYQDVYEHLFESEQLILKLLMDEEEKLAGFGVFESYQLTLDKKFITMLYLSGMVIEPKYQGRNISREIIKSVYKQVQADLVSLRTQNIAMATSLIRTFDTPLFVMPSEVSADLLKVLRQTQPFKTINDEGVIEKCYSNQLYDNLKAINDSFGITLDTTDALGVVVEPNDKGRIRSLFKKEEK